MHIMYVHYFGGREGGGGRAGRATVFKFISEQVCLKIIFEINACNVYIIFALSSYKMRPFKKDFFFLIVLIYAVM